MVSDKEVGNKIDEELEKKKSDAKYRRIIQKFFVTEDYVIDLTKITFINIKMRVIQIEGVGINLSTMCSDEWGSFQAKYFRVRNKMQKEFHDGN